MKLIMFFLAISIPVFGVAASCTEVYTNRQGNTYLECSDGRCGFDNRGRGGGYHQTRCYRGIYKRRVPKVVNRNAQCDLKYPGTIYRASDGMCVCPGTNPMGWNLSTFCR